MKKIVVWSGGLDSTLLLNNLAKESSEENPVFAFSFKLHIIHDIKDKMEVRARKNYLKYAKQQGYHIEHNVITIDGPGYPSETWAQQKSWLCFILPYMPNNCEINFGYIQSDSIWPALDNHLKILENFQYLGGIGDSRLSFPFTFKEKWEVLKEFQEEGIPENCFWTCEKPLKKPITPCGKCEPCIHLKMAKQELQYRKSINRV